MSDDQKPVDPMPPKRGRGRPRKYPITVEERERLSGSLTPQTESDALARYRDPDNPAIDDFDVPRRQKQILVMGYTLLLYGMQDRLIPIAQRIDWFFKAQTNWEGTRREIVYDTRKVDDRVLLAQREKIQAELVKYGAMLSQEQKAKIEQDAAEMILKATEPPAPEKAN